MTKHYTSAPERESRGILTTCDECCIIIYGTIWKHERKDFKIKMKAEGKTNMSLSLNGCDKGPVSKCCYLETASLETTHNICLTLTIKDIIKILQREIQLHAHIHFLCISQYFYKTPWRYSHMTTNYRSTALRITSLTVWIYAHYLTCCAFQCNVKSTCNQNCPRSSEKFRPKSWVGDQIFCLRQIKS